MEKNGFLRIGYIGNLREYPQRIRELTGSYYDYVAFDSHINELWANKEENVLCYNANGEQVDAQSDNIALILIDIGMKHKDTEETLYARFTQTTPSSFLDACWMGVQIGTKEELLAVLSDEPADGDLISFTYIDSFQPIARLLSDLTGETFTEVTCRELLQTSFESAKETDTLAIATNKQNPNLQKAFFPVLDCFSLGGHRIFVKMEKNNRPGSIKWFGAFLETEEEIKDELLSFFAFHVGNFLFESQSDANSFLNGLAQKAMKENWCWNDPTQNSTYSQPILKSYLEFTYYRLMDEDKTASPDNKKCVDFNNKRYFNSGLLDRNFRQIIIVGDIKTLTENIPGYGDCSWELLANLRAYSHNEHEIARDFDEHELPRTASYFKDYSEVVFNAALSINTNDNHIFEDGVARGRLPKYKAEYDAVKNNPEEKDLLLARIARDFDSAIKRASLMAERNYKLAVPQFWKETGEIQFLLPIYLGEREEAEKPQCALVLSLDTSGRRPNYRGETILTLDMAYNNTRLIAKPDIFWLNDLV